jgi:phosphoadenosine phosphosulfate reductase
VSLQSQFKDLPIQNIFKELASSYPGRITFSTSFSYEDQVITDLIVKSGASISLFTLDTGRLFNETYTVWSQTLARYNIKIKAFYPDKKRLQFFVSQNGPNAFYQSVELRKQCCHIRKVIPLKKALEEQSVWITGLRAGHSSERSSLNNFEWDEANQIIKYHPLLQWTTEEIRNYVKENEVPYNSLHEKGFVSIGCAPCTRAIKKGEDFRAGRWWWEGAEKKECGLHTTSEKIKI